LPPACSPARAKKAQREKKTIKPDGVEEEEGNLEGKEWEARPCASGRREGR